MCDSVKTRQKPMRSAYSLDDVNVLMAAAGFKPVPSFETTYLKESYRNKFGTLPFEIPYLLVRYVRGEEQRRLMPE